YQNAYLEQSLRMSTLVQKEVSDFAGRNNRGVKQAGFLVLWKTSMPGTYIETGFLTNPNEERYMVSKEGQEKIAFSIYKAFAAYKNGAEASASTKEEEPKPDAKETVKKKPPVLIDTAHVSKPETENKTEPKKETASPEPKLYTPVKKKNDSEEKVKMDTAEKAVTKSDAESEIYFTVQIATSGKLHPKNSPLFKGEKNIVIENISGLYKYMTGKFSNLSEALTRQKELRASGFNDAFVAAYHNGVRITVPQAETLLKKN
ncbi:MAG: N-acetylmuramoyl-L-alanine amidase, partial [Bacteroidia bacterium]|nr:N-acetylmuramoyl-L-alanine amidase [Bacteroidia bacterium]